VPEHFCWFIASSSHGCCWATVKPIFSARYCLLEISRLAGQQNHFQTDDSHGDVPVTTSFLYPLFSTLRLRCQEFSLPNLKLRLLSKFQREQRLKSFHRHMLPMVIRHADIQKCGNCERRFDANYAETMSIRRQLHMLEQAHL